MTAVDVFLPVHDADTLVLADDEIVRLAVADAGLDDGRTIECDRAFLRWDRPWSLASRLLLETQPPGADIIFLRSKEQDERVLEAARDVVAHAYAVVARHEARIAN